MEIRPVSYREILGAADARELLEEYAVECSLPELAPAEPQPHMYEALEKVKAIQCFGAYEGDNLVGFATLMIYVLPHYGKKIAGTESIFLSQDWRVAGNGEQMLHFIEQFAREQGCVAVFYSAPESSRFLRLLAARYRHTNCVFLRSLI